MKCKECEFWHKKVNSVSEGSCRRYPKYMFTGRNIIDQSDWCGEFSEKPIAKDKKNK